MTPICLDELAARGMFDAMRGSLPRLCATSMALATLAFSAACAAPVSEEAGQSEAAWGHLKESGLTATSPQFLINKAPGQKYRVCLASYMQTLYPGIETEIDAAINVWGVYLGRAIPVEVVVKDLPRAVATDTLQSLIASYNERCGQGFDTVVGLAPLENGAVGVTSAPYRFFPEPDGSQRIVSFTRGVFLKDYDLQPDTFAGAPESWSSLRGAGIDIGDRDALLATMTERDRTEYVSAGRFLALPVLAHEFGHVWGMCDQYESSSNCDAAHSTSHRVEDSIMSSRGARERLYLTDDDIEGIRALAARAGFGHDWDAQVALAAAPRPIVRKPVELARIDEVRLEGTTLIVRYGLVTTKKTHYEFAIRAEGTETFRPLQNAFESETGVESVGAQLNISLGRAQTYAVRLRIQVANETGELGPAIEVTR